MALCVLRKACYDMNKHTNLKKIIEIAISFLYLELKPTGIYCFVTHPFTQSVAVANMDRNTTRYLLDLNNPDDYDIWISQMKKRFENITNISELFLYLTKPYILTFLKYIKPYLSQDDFSMLLSNHWKCIEQISLDTNVTSRLLVSWFKQCNPNILMSDSERQTIQELPDMVTLYRGVTSYNNKQKRALSWTLDKNIAEWFAHRYQTNDGEVWTIIVPKSAILCYFGDNSSEEEIILNPYACKGCDIQTKTL